MTEAAKPEPLRFLIVDDSHPDSAMLSRMLRKRFGEKTQIAEAHTGSQAMEMLAEGKVDVALIDYRLPDMDGLEVLDQLEAGRHNVASILLTGQGSERLAADAIKHGANDYLVKDQFDPPQLERVISEAVVHVRQRAEQQKAIAELQRSRSDMDHFVRSLSHDMSANYMLLEHSLARIKQSCSSDPRPALTQGVTHIEACLKESKQYLDDLALLARSGTIQTNPERVELEQAAAEVLFELDDLLSERSIRCITEPELPAVWCHPGRIRQLLSNLVRNAAKHGCDPDHPLIAIRRAPHSPTDERTVWLEVFDNGPGIPVESRDTIFLPGRRLNSSVEGSGMGLAIVKQIVEHYGGQIFVSSEVVSGTAFVCSLPVAV